MKFKKRSPHFVRNIIFSVIGGIALVLGCIFIWVATIKIPDFQSFDLANVAKSTKIYDRTGEVLLYDIHDDYKRTVIPFDDMGANIKNATVAVEDSEFYQHHGIRVKSIFRAILATIFKSGTQGGSTITQQVVKNSLLTKEKTIPRKIKEWVLSVKLEQVMSKEQILALYLNGNPYGGNVYGIDEAAHEFFNKAPKDMTIAEAAYVASIPQLPSYYSPYGKNVAKLEERKNFVLSRMKELGFITADDYTTARAEVVAFQPKEPVGIKAPHFVFFIKDYLTTKYGEQKMAEGGLKVTTTLDYDLEKQAEAAALKNALANEKAYNASNTAVVILDPKTGQILTMVGSRDFFDKKIDGQFNVATASRQPGSSFKPFVYATAFEKGFTPETVLFDVPTEFNASCSPYGSSKSAKCYMPDDYDNKFRGPMELRDALAQSINVPAVKLLYLVGVSDALKVAKDMGIKTLTDPARYGLTLVLGGGEVSPLDMASAYGVFANNGVREEPTGILKVEDENGTILEEYTTNEHEVLPKNIALTVSDILSDNNARIPTFGATSTLNIPGHDVAVKTGTTNLNKDAWMIGYSTSAVVAVWSGNNENTSMKKGSTVSGPTFNEMMRAALSKYPESDFEEPLPADNYASLKPVLRGKWLGGETFTIDSISGKLATADTPLETQVEKVVTNVHDILYWVDKNDILGPTPTNPEKDSQFKNWETAVQDWWRTHAGEYPSVSLAEKPTLYDDVHTAASKPIISISSPNQATIYDKNASIPVSIQSMSNLRKVDFFVNGNYLGSSTTAPFLFSFSPNEVDGLGQTNELKVVGYDQVYNKGETIVPFQVNQ